MSEVHPVDAAVDRVVAAQRKVRALVVAHREALVARDAAVVGAVEVGASMLELERACGVSRQHIWKIVRGHN